ncbi:MAG: type II secretion system F family protein [bacterium]
MAIFNYKAKDKSGQKVEGQIEANDRLAALRQVEQRGLIPVSITPGISTAPATPKKAKPKTAPSFSLSLNRTPKMKTRDVLIFSTELSDLLASGMNLGQALTTLANRKTGAASDDIIRDIRDQIIQGTPLSDSMAKHPRSFPQLYVSMVKVGEASGALAEVMTRLVEHYERLQDLKEKVVMALVYPAIVLFMGFATMIFSMVFVIPKFSAIFKELNSTLPLPTQLLIGMSNWLLKYGWLGLIVMIAGIIFLKQALQTPVGKERWHRMQLKTPFIKGIVASSTYANFARTLATLLNNGVPALQALTIVEQTIGNVVIAAEIRNARDRVTDGTTISGPLAAGGVFPPLMTDMLAIGEQTGDMAGALKHIAHRYENELNRNVKLFTTALEPILIVVVALLVGFIAVSIVMAVFNVTNGLGV